MTFGDFLGKYKFVFVAIILIIVSLMIYRYYWERKSLLNDIRLHNIIYVIGQKLDRLESAIGLTGPQVSAITSQNKNNIVCLDPETQRKIAQEVSEKLNEINYCDCKKVCMAMDQPSQQGNNI